MLNTIGIGTEPGGWQAVTAIPTVQHLNRFISSYKSIDESGQYTGTANNPSLLFSIDDFDWKGYTEGSFTISNILMGKREVIRPKFGSVYESLPTPERSNAEFLGWYTSVNDGELVTNETIVTNLQTHYLYARWITCPTGSTIVDDESKGGKICVKNKEHVYDSFECNCEKELVKHVDYVNSSDECELFGDSSVGGGSWSNTTGRCIWNEMVEVCDECPWEGYVCSEGFNEYNENQCYKVP